MLPSWDVIQQIWPLVAAIAGLWARMEVAMALGRRLSIQNEREIADLKVKLETQSAVAQTQAVQLGRIEEAIKGQGKTLDLIANAVASRGHQ